MKNPFVKVTIFFVVKATTTCTFSIRVKVYVALFALLHICYSQITKTLYKVNYTNHRGSINEHYSIPEYRVSIHI